MFDVRCILLLYYILYIILLYIISYTILFLPFHSPLIYLLSLPPLPPLLLFSSPLSLPIIPLPPIPSPFLSQSSFPIPIFQPAHSQASHSKYTCRHLDILIYIIIQEYLTPHVLSEWMVEVCRFEYLGILFGDWCFERLCLTLGVYYYYIIYYILYYYILYLILYSSFPSILL